MNNSTSRVICTFAFLALNAVNTAHAFEGDVSPYPAGAGGTDIGTFPPIPGIFVLEQLNYTYANALYGNGGEKSPIPFRESVFSTTTRILAAYPATILGANVYSQLILPFVSLHTNIEGQNKTQNGLSNITFSPVIFSWKLANHIELVNGLDIALPTGSYSPTKPSVSANYFSLQPVFTARYNNPNGLDIGVSNRFLINQKNQETGYTSGDAYVGEFTAGWNFGNFKVGVVGAYLNQYSDDRSNGATVPNNRAKYLAIGPSIVYQAGPVNINLNFQQGVYAANTAKSSQVWLNIAIPLWVKTPDRHARGLDTGF